MNSYLAYCCRLSVRPHKWLFYIATSNRKPREMCFWSKTRLQCVLFRISIFICYSRASPPTSYGRWAIFTKIWSLHQSNAWVLVPAHWSIARSRAICVVIQVWSQVQYGGSLASDSCFRSHHTRTGAVSAPEQERADIDTGIACRHPHLRSRATAICLWPYDTCSDSSDTRPAAAARAYGLFPRAVHLFFSSRQSISAVFPHRYHHLALHAPRLVPRRPPRPP
ncbi:hypothetical protein K439DRAFT_1004632 [Ramaria rubella]|nr:hypothetical protein K439DRAFT_1004632 [Ramaria rubella]